MNDLSVPVSPHLQHLFWVAGWMLISFSAGTFFSARGRREHRHSGWKTISKRAWACYIKQDGYEGRSDVWCIGEIQQCGTCTLKRIVPFEKGYQITEIEGYL